MKLIGLCLCLLFVSCSTGKLTFPERAPGSFQEKTLRYDLESLSGELSEGQFFEFIKEAQNRKYEKVVFAPKEPLLIKASYGNETYVAGDFFVLIGTNFAGNDEIIRKGDYDDIYAVAKRMAWLKFRVTINLVASIDDLKIALANNRPTIIVWTSHGNQQSFYDFNQVPVPSTIFKDASPSVYQFHLASCEGYQAIQNKYLPHIPKTMKHWAWQTLTYHPGTLKPHFDQEIWNPFINYPGTFTNKGLSCQKQEERFVIYDGIKKALVGDFSYDKAETCNYVVANASDKLVCNKKGEKWEIYQRKNLTVIPGTPFDNHYDCHSRITNVNKNKMCRRFEDTNQLHTIDITTLVRSADGFANLWDCYDYIEKTNDT